MKFTIVSIIAAIVSLAGFVVMAGWIFSIPILASWIPDAITMKFTTALSFFLSGIILYCIGRAPRVGCRADGIVLPMASFILALIMGTFLASVMFGIHTGIEDVFVKDLTPAVHASVPGRPAVPTAIAFLLVAAVGFFWTAEAGARIAIVRVCGSIVAVIGGVALVGYLIDQPALYYVVVGVSNPVAFSSAILFVLLGTGLLYSNGAYKRMHASDTDETTRL